ncbi:hypothetical protein [Tautonia plasticadhaerens]|uniref:DUF4034 domain-containing protein n=1 Tax=Tautonia plasticadhaerens TaxID=2527974 RepID=A0A518GV28_9BACT|nr:hypothetical protein [Tautonia plasticadhaerens]QDV32437.1 hypothetical protein ElP_02690 [Tautonia plasticadhaerens]
MRRMIALGLILLASASAAGIVMTRPLPAPESATAPAPGPAEGAPADLAGESPAVEAPGPDRDPPRKGKSPGIVRGALSTSEIPQDLDRMEQRRREKLEWNRRTVLGAYDEVGRKDPRWDESAREAMDLASRMFGLQVDPVVTLADLRRPARAALDAGCDDPMLAYLHTRTLVALDVVGPAELARLMIEAAEGLRASDYPACRRAVALELAGTQVVAASSLGGPPREQAGRYFDDALALMPESVRTDARTEHWRDLWFDTLRSLVTGYRALGLEPVEAYERVDAGLAGLPEAEALRLVVRGWFWFDYGWEARTNAFAPAVPAGGFERLEDRLALSREAFEAAWELEPDNARVASYLMDIDKSIVGDRAVMERWFDRAMRADGDWYAACLTKLDWLDPKWHGSVEEMLAFGRSCFETGNWRAGITLLSPDAHFRYACMVDRAEGTRYLSSPEVWPEIREAYDEYLEHYPDNNVARSKYAALATIAGNYPEAHAQFERLGDRLTMWSDSPYIPLGMLELMREEAARMAVGGQP